MCVCVCLYVCKKGTGNMVNLIAPTNYCVYIVQLTSNIQCGHFIKILRSEVIGIFYQTDLFVSMPTYLIYMHIIKFSF